jgi:hypothetical protein
MQPVRHYSDPYEGLEAQLAELRGLVRIVPPLIDTDWNRRWDELGKRAGDPDEEMIDIYESEAGPEERWGHADFARTLYSTAIVTAWETFNVYLVRQLFEGCLNYNFSEYPVLAKLIEDERRTWERRFENVIRRYKDFAQINLSSLSSWEAVVHARELRHALVHNLGWYTPAYLKTKRARRPAKEHWDFYIPDTDDGLVDNEPIPLDRVFSEQVIADLLTAGKEVNEALRGGR